MNFENKIIEASRKLGQLFEVAKETWITDFKFDIEHEDWLKKSDSRYGIQKYMDFLIRLLEIEYYYLSLAQKKAELESRKGSSVFEI